MLHSAGYNIFIRTFNGAAFNIIFFNSENGILHILTINFKILSLEIVPFLVEII